METSSDDLESNNDILNNLPAVNIQSSNSGSSSKSELQPEDLSIKRKKTNNKKNKKEVRNALMKELAEEKAATKRAQELYKIYKPGDCMKYMRVEMHPDLLGEWYAEEVDQELGEIGVKIERNPDLCDRGLVLWKRCVPPKLVAKEGMVEMTSSEERCDRGLYVMTMLDVLPEILEKSLIQHVRKVSEEVNARLTLVIFGARDYLRTIPRRTEENKNYIITEVDLELVITDLLVSYGCDTVLVNSANELAVLIAQSTKAVAEAPYKKGRHLLDDQADFYMRGDNRKCVSVDRDGNGLNNLWQQMLSVLPLCSLETSRALCAKYNTPLNLHEALLAPDSIQTIADLGVTRSGVPGSKARRIGPEFAKKLHILFTAEDGDTLIE